MSPMRLLRVLAAGLGVVALGSLAPVPGNEVLLPTAHADDSMVEQYKVSLDNCWFDGHIRSRSNFGGVNYGPVVVKMEQLKKPPARYGGRPVEVTGLVMPGIHVGNRQTPPQPSSGYNTGSAAGVDPGHLFALHLGGPEDSQTIVPQWNTWQRAGPWRDMEKTIDKEAREAADKSRPAGGGPPTQTVFYSVQIEYQPVGAVTPRIQVWGFPKAFYVTACVVDMGRLNGPLDQACTKWLYKQQRFEGGPS